MSPAASAPTPSSPSSSDDADHYFSAEPSAESDRQCIELHLPDLSLTLTTDRGVFARQGVDPGTKLLLLHGPDPNETDSNLLDLGCGYGPIALTLAHRNPSARVWAVDVNERARDLCRLNARDAGLDNVEVVGPDDVPTDVRLDRIWSNPPIRIGKAALRRLLTQWLDRLGPKGSAHFVVQKHLGSDSLHHWLDDSGWATTRRRSQSAYRLLDVSARTDSDVSRVPGPDDEPPQ